MGKVNKIDDGKITLPEGRMDFPSLFEKRVPQGKDEDDGKYEITVLFDNKDLKKARQLVDDLIAERWPNEKKRPKVKKPFRKPDEDRVEKMPHYEDCIFIMATTKFKPLVMDAKKNDIKDPSEIYSGAYCHVRVSPYIWEYQNKFGVSFNLLAVQKTNDCDDDERFVKMVDHSEYFDEVEVDDDDEDDDDDDDNDSDDSDDSDDDDEDEDEDEDDGSRKNKKKNKKKKYF